MLQLQNWKIKSVYIGFGSFFGCLCAIIGILASPVTALGVGENGGIVGTNDKFGNTNVLD